MDDVVRDINDLKENSAKGETLMVEHIKAALRSGSPVCSICGSFDANSAVFNRETGILEGHICYSCWVKIGGGGSVVVKEDDPGGDIGETIRLQWEELRAAFPMKVVEEREAILRECYEAIAKYVRRGEFGREESDGYIRRNGLIMALNIISSMIAASRGERGG